MLPDLPATCTLTQWHKAAAQCLQADIDVVCRAGREVRCIVLSIFLLLMSCRALIVGVLATAKWATLSILW